MNDQVMMKRSGKNMSIVKRLILTSLVTDVIIIILLYTGYGTASNMRTHEDPDRLLRGYGIFTLVMFVVIAIILIVMNVSMIHTIRVCFKDLNNVANKLAAGDVTVRSTVDGKDEFGQLAQAFSGVADTMRAQTDVARMVAEGNLTIDVQTKSDADALNIALRDMVTKNKASLTGINDAARQVNTAALEVSCASEALAQGSTEQASAIEQITVSIGDVAKKTKTNAKEASNAAELFESAINNVNKGNEQMQEMMDAMTAINESSDKIGKIIKVIDDIAFQTNILALNAAVEAARAGEAGKGFAVVAEEVRNLAAKSASAASETAELIEDSIAKVERGSMIADNTAKALSEITSAVSESETIIKGIAEASNQQATAIAQIDQAIEQVSMVVQTNSATSEECAAASIELSNQATYMQELLSVYYLGNTTANVSVAKSFAPKSFEKKEKPVFEKPVFTKPVDTTTPEEKVAAFESKEDTSDIIPTPTFFETTSSIGVEDAEKIISLGDDLGKF